MDPRPRTPIGYRLLNELGGLLRGIAARVTSRETCPTCQARVTTRAALETATGGERVALPFDALRKLPADERRAVSRAIDRRNVDAATRAESDAALQETERDIRSDSDLQ